MAVEAVPLTNAEIVATCSVIDAACALLVSIWQGVVIRTHNRLASRPVIDMNLHANSQKILLEIVNCGLGPGFLESLAVSHSDTTYDLLKKDSFIRFIGTVLPAGLTHPPTNGHFQAGTVMPIGSLPLLQFQGDPDPTLVSFVQTAFEGAHFTIGYRCIYGSIEVVHHKF